MSDCPRFNECSNAEAKCHLCTNFSQFKAGTRSKGKGTRFEKKIQQLRQQPRTHLRAGSGAVATAKGDLIDSQALYEAKNGYQSINTKGRKTFVLSREVLLKIQDEALQEGRLPVLVIHFDGAPDDEAWAVMRFEAMSDLLDKLKEQP
jgi:hypothetical protein